MITDEQFDTISHSESELRSRNINSRLPSPLHLVDSSINMIIMIDRRYDRLNEQWRRDIAKFASLQIVNCTVAHSLTITHCFAHSLTHRRARSHAHAFAYNYLTRTIISHRVTRRHHVGACTRVVNSHEHVSLDIRSSHRKRFRFSNSSLTIRFAGDVAPTPARTSESLSIRSR